MCQLYHIPKSVMQRHALNDGQAAVLACADLVSQKRYGVPAMLLPTETRELVIAFLEELWEALDELPPVVPGRAS